MFSSIRTKLIALIVIANVLMIAIVLLFNYATFNRSFSGFIEQQESRRFSLLLENIAREYQHQGDWHWLSWESSRWREVLIKSLSPRELRSMPRAQNLNMMRHDLERLVIIDGHSQEPLLGRKKKNAKMLWLPIKIDDVGKPIAFLGFEPSKRLDAEFDAVFAQQMRSLSLVFALFAVIIATLLAIPFAGWLTRPIRQLNSAMSDIHQGNLAVRIAGDRRDELGQLAQDFNRMASALQQSQKAREQWVSDIAHELRTPVAVLQADIEAAQDGIRAIDERWLASMHNQNARLARLVSDLHQLSQSDAGALNYRFDRVDLTALVNETVTQYQSACQQGYINCRVKGSETAQFVRGDDKRLSQLLNNLMENTLRYTDGTEQQPATLQIALQADRDCVRMTWQDSSPGVPEASLDKLFDRLYRVDESRSRDSGGSGLGLAIVKNIVAAHEGNISASHSPLGGLCLTVELPTMQEI